MHRWITAALVATAATAQAAPTVTDYSLFANFTTSIFTDRIGNSRLFNGPNTDRVRVSANPSPTPDSDVFIAVSNGQEFLSSNGTLTTVSFSHPTTGSFTPTFVGLTSGFGGGRNEFTASFNRAALAAGQLAAFAAEPFVVTVRNPRTPNGVHEISRTTPAFDPDAMPAFVRDVSLTGNGVNPLIEWSVPTDGAAPTHVSIQVRRIDGESADGRRITKSTLVHSGTVPLAQNQFQFGSTPFSNAGLPGFPQGLELGQRYEISVQLDVREASGNLLGRSRTFFEMTPLADGANDVKVYLPSAGPDGRMKFDVEVKRGEKIAIDPVVAIGYDYAIGSGDPLFRSVSLPHVGDGLYELWLDLGAGYERVTTLAADEEYFFDGLGVNAFRVLGIEASAGLDPNDVSAFVTTLTFAGDGRFTGTMTPIRLEVAEVPLPGTLPLLALGLAALQGRLRRRSTRGLVSGGAAPSSAPPAPVPAWPGAWARARG